MTLVLTLCGFAILYGVHLGSYMAILAFILFFHLSQGSVAWLYVPEVTVDAASGLAVGAQFINLSIISLTFEFMIAGPLKSHGSIWYFAVWNFVGFIFMIVVVKETRGLTDKQKKLLYSPVSLVQTSVEEKKQWEESEMQDVKTTGN